MAQAGALPQRMAASTLAWVLWRASRNWTWPPGVLVAVTWYRLASCCSNRVSWAPGCGCSRRMRIRMSGGHPEAVPAGGVAQQPGELGDLRVRPRRAVGVQGRAPCCLGQVRQDGADPLSSRARPSSAPGARAGVQRGDVIDQGVGGPGAVAGDQHLAAVLRGDLRDRGVHDGEVVRRWCCCPRSRGCSCTASDSSVLSHQAVSG